MPAPAPSRSRNREQADQPGPAVVSAEAAGRPVDHEPEPEPAGASSAAAGTIPLPAPIELRPGVASIRPPDGTPARIDLETVLAGISAGVTVQDQDGRLLFVNALAAELAGYDDPADMLAASQAARLERFGLVDEGGAPFPAAERPGRRA